MSVSRLALLAGLTAFSTTSQAQDAGGMDLGTLYLEAESDDTLVQNGYVAESGRQATRVDTSIRDIPQNISTVTQDQIEDQQPRTLLDALGYSSGTNVNAFGYDSRYDAVYLRGFSSYYNGLFRDGLRQVNGPSAWYQNHPYSFEAVSVLKGPSSSMYGVSGSGGIVNVVSKRPKDESFNEIQLTFGTDDRKELAFDFTGPVGDGRLSYRLTGVTRDADTPLDGYSDDLNMIAPALTYELTDRTTITLLSEYAKSMRGGTASYYNEAYGEASDYYIGDPDYNDFVNEQWRIGYEVEHALTDTITLRQKLRYSEVDADLEFSGVYDTGAGFGRYWGHYLEDSENLTIDTSVETAFSTGSWAHTVVGGFDFARSSYETYYGGVGYVSAAATDAADQPYSGGQDMDQYGIYLHDQLSSGPWTVFLSGRYDWVETTTFDAAHDGTDTSDEGFSGRLGLSYAINSDLSVFANVSSSFVPTTGIVYDSNTDPDSGHTGDPTRGLQKEIGLKYQLPGTESLITASLFDIQQEDGVVFQTVDSTVFGGLYQVQVPYDLRSRGFEVEGQFNFANDLRLTTSYTYLDMEIERGATGTEGNQLSATPEHAASVWAFYEPTNGALAGWGFGAGLRYVGESWGDDENTFKNDDQLYADLSLSYDFGRVGYDGLGLQVNVKNVFDNTDQTCSAGYCYRTEGRTATASIAYRF
ncbi:TonB-dependent siderophore receptor [Salipiger sp. 1_MG-2023]|uniref:TonB-dependent siderophore receptor n=1 Tax=Salipiger sp. 1_MG-2023 TaxID=3062665 RepID=UPI0026E3EE4C|nr:TonB-dependent siderophore receptor [Salipiger sp. 1_MG-2023]MDO6586975.1 TonB-dependent siderophore receptor [Salipiger sp. 1_MG-2023]